MVNHGGMVSKRKGKEIKERKKKRGKESKFGTTAEFGTRITVLKAEGTGNKALIFLCMFLQSQEEGPFAAQEIGKNLCMYLFAVLPFSFSRSRCTQPAGDWVR